jgi:hypothetical protein
MNDPSMQAIVQGRRRVLGQSGFHNPQRDENLITKTVVNESILLQSCTVCLIT